MARATTFHATIAQTGKNTTGIIVPEQVVTELGAGKRPPVLVTVNGYSYRSSIASMGGRYMISLSAENRANSRLSGGEEANITVEVDEQPRTVDVPSDFALALASVASATQAFDTLSYSRQRRYVLAIEGAKTPETRQRRIDSALLELCQV